MIRIKASIAIAVAAGTLALAGCGSALPGTAAQVGEQRITVDSLQSQVDAVLDYRSDRPGSTVRDQLPSITQQLLSGDVLHELADLAVARTQFTVDEKAIAEQIAKLDPTVLDNPGVNFITPVTLPQFVHDQLVIAQLGSAAWDGLAVTADLATATDRADAETKAKRMAQGPAESAAVVAEATAAGQQSRAAYPLSPATLEGLTSTPLFAAPVGSAVAFSVGKQWQAARITSRTTNAPPNPAPEAVPASQAKPSSTYALGVSLVGELAGNPEVRINPRYGSWDATQGQVVATTAAPNAIVFNGRA